MTPESITGDIEVAGSIESRLLKTRRLSLELVEPLSAEDMTVQAMDDASPTKWHLAHVTWFFETFILTKHLPGYQTFDDSFNYCFNSYYESQGPRQPRPRRGVLTRPSSERLVPVGSRWTRPQIDPTASAWDSSKIGSATAGTSRRILVRRRCLRDFAR